VLRFEDPAQDSLASRRAIVRVERRHRGRGASLVRRRSAYLRGGPDRQGARAAPVSALPAGPGLASVV